MKKLLLCALMLAISCAPILAQTQYKVLWSFAGGTSDGAIPMGPLTFDKSGNLYGTTDAGGISTCSGGCGTVFELSPNGDGTWSNTILYSFCTSVFGNQCLDGAHPQARVIFDTAGNLYGTTVNGGGQDCSFDSRGCGTVFELSPPTVPGGGWTETVLHAFCADEMNNLCLDGGAPVSELTFDGLGNIYGTTTVGGTGPTGAGTVFELSPDLGGWTESVLYTFCGAGGYPVCPDGDKPLAGITFDKAGNLYGTTWLGGSEKGQGGGTVYQLSPSANGWTETVLYRFLSPFRAGGGPSANVSIGKRGTLYTTVSSGCRKQNGGIFRFTPANGKGQSFCFNGLDGNDPIAGVRVDANSETLYGTTFAGGSAQGGTVFKIVAPAQESVLYNFCSQQKCADGAGPSGLIFDGSGNLYSTAEIGGAHNFGVVFEIIQQAPTGKQHASQRTH